tara:strand:+ start:792 stop:962 length:171 start_codon:yes stop_codon:yes gene_type:complete
MCIRICTYHLSIVDKPEIKVVINTNIATTVHFIFTRPLVVEMTYNFTQIQAKAKET